MPVSSSDTNQPQLAAISKEEHKVGKLITLDDAAERLAISKRGVRRLVSSGKLKAYRINARVIRVDSADLASVLEPVVPTGKD